jgi:hypothetical protein
VIFAPGFCQEEKYLCQQQPALPRDRSNGSVVRGINCRVRDGFGCCPAPMAADVYNIGTRVFKPYMRDIGEVYA